MNADGNMPYECCLPGPTLSLIETEMDKRGMELVVVISLIKPLSCRNVLVIFETKFSSFVFLTVECKMDNLWNKPLLCIGIYFRFFGSLIFSLLPSFLLIPPVGRCGFWNFSTHYLASVCYTCEYRVDRWFSDFLSRPFPYFLIIKPRGVCQHHLLCLILPIIWNIKLETVKPSSS